MVRSSHPRPRQRVICSHWFGSPVIRPWYYPQRQGLSEISPLAASERLTLRQRQGIGAIKPHPNAGVNGTTEGHFNLEHRKVDVEKNPKQLLCPLAVRLKQVLNNNVLTSNFPSNSTSQFLSWSLPLSRGHGCPCDTYKSNILFPDICSLFSYSSNFCLCSLFHHWLCSHLQK